MKICPGCKEEFLDHIEQCASCEEQLVDESQIDLLATKKNDQLLSKEEFFQGESAQFIESSLGQCREVERTLQKAGVSCVVYPLSLKSGGNPATLGSSCEMRYVVLVRVEDVSKARDAMQGSFFAQVAKEGQGRFVTDAVDLEQDQITCPACNETGALSDGECKSCGLFLGTNE